MTWCWLLGHKWNDDWIQLVGRPGEEFQFCDRGPVRNPCKKMKGRRR